MSKSHNKKRNVGIIFEQLVEYISEAVLEKDHDRAQKALTIIRNNFKRGSQLYREFRLFNAFIKTQVDHASLASRILEEAKKAALEFDRNKLMQEKSMLIKEINHKLGDSMFYSRRVKHYRDFATIQTLLNDWRNMGIHNFDRVTKYENEVCKWLLAEKSEPVDADSDLSEYSEADSLAVKIMAEKFNSKYNDILNQEQSRLIKEYVFSKDSGETANIKVHLKEILKDSLGELDGFRLTCNNQILSEKIDNVKTRLREIDVENIDDSLIAKILTVAKLKEQLLENDDE